MIEVLTGVAVALLVSMTTYASKLQRGETFDPRKLLRTVAIGLVGGIGAAITGAEITAENWDAYIAANTGVVALVDQIIKIAGRWLGPIFGPKNGKPKVGLPIIILCLFLPLATIGCSTTGGHTGTQTEQTVLDTAKTFIMQGKRAEGIYTAIVKAYSVAYKAYKDTPSVDNQKTVKRMQKLHGRAFILYEDFRAFHSTLIYLVGTYEGRPEDDQALGTANGQIENILLDLLFLAATINKGG